MHPFVDLMRTYCIDYTNSHDLDVCDQIMDPSYVVEICGFELARDEAYKPSVEQVYTRFPALGLVVHELVTNGERLAMRFSEHAATTDGRLACWAGIGLYEWNGTTLTRCRVEQDFVSQARQLETGIPDRLEPPHLDPWTTTDATPPDVEAEVVARRWLGEGNLGAAPTGRIDETTLDAYQPFLEVSEVRVDDVFSAGDRVAFRAHLDGAATGAAADPETQGSPVTLTVVGLLAIESGQVADVRVVTDRRTALRAMVGRPRGGG